MKKIKSKNIKKFYFILSLLIFIIFLSQLFLSNRLTIDGKRLEKVQREIKRVETENDYLKKEIASFGGLTKLSVLAEEKGFVKNPHIINLSNRIPIAAYSVP